MDFNLTEEQKLLHKAARDFLTAECPTSLVREMAKDEEGHPHRLWQQMAELGWMGLIIPEQYGGEGGSFFDLVVLLEEMGRVCLPGPFFSTVVLGGLTVLEAGNEEQKEELLPKLAQGELLLTLALTEVSDKYSADGIETESMQRDSQFLIRGTKLFVPDAHISDYLICPAKAKEALRAEDAVSLFLVDAKSPGITCTLLKTLAGEKQCEVTFNDANVPGTNVLGGLGQGWPILNNVLKKAVVARSAMMLGGAKRVLEMTVEYAKQRKAFGHPIGSFQAIQHYCANMLTDLDGCSFVVYEAAWQLGEGLSAAQEAAMAKALVNERFKGITALAMQIHGAIGFTEDHDLPLYFKRAKAWETDLGDTNFHLDKVGRAVGI